MLRSVTTVGWTVTGAHDAPGKPIAQTVTTVFAGERDRLTRGRSERMSGACPHCLKLRRKVTPAC